MYFSIGPYYPICPQGPDRARFLSTCQWDQLKISIFLNTLLN